MMSPLRAMVADEWILKPFWQPMNHLFFISWVEPMKELNMSNNIGWLANISFVGHFWRQNLSVSICWSMTGG